MTWWQKLKRYKSKYILSRLPDCTLTILLLTQNNSKFWNSTWENSILLLIEPIMCNNDKIHPLLVCSALLYSLYMFYLHEYIITMYIMLPVLTCNHYLFITLLAFILDMDIITLYFFTLINTKMNIFEFWSLQETSISLWYFYCKILEKCKSDVLLN